MKALIALAVIIFVVQFFRKKVASKKLSQSDESNPNIIDNTTSTKKKQSDDGIIREPLVIHKTQKSSDTPIIGTPVQSLFDFCDVLDEFDRYSFVEERLFIRGKRKLGISDDFGKTWTIKNTEELFIKISFVTKNTGFACSNSALYKTTDSGDNWQMITKNNDLKSIGLFQFLNENVGFFTGIGTDGVSGTFDGGKSISGSYKNGMLVQKGNQVMLYNTKGSKYKNPDANHYLPSIISFTNKKGQHRKNIDWEPIENHKTLDENSKKIKFISATIGFAISAGCIHKTTDGGLSWETFEVYPTDNLIITRAEIYFSDDVFGIALVSNTICTTKDGGETWNILKGNYRGHVRSVFCANKNNLIIICTNAGIYYSYDFGATFTPSFLIDITTIWGKHFDFDISKLVGKWHVEAIKQKKNEVPYELVKNDFSAIWKFTNEANTPWVKESHNYSAYYDILPDLPNSKYLNVDSLRWSISKEYQHKLYLEKVRFWGENSPYIRDQYFDIVELTDTKLVIEVPELITINLKRA